MNALSTLMLVGWFCLAAAAPKAAAAPAPDGITTYEVRVASFHAELLAMTQIAEHRPRAAAIAPSVAALFDVRRIAQVSLGKTWRNLSEPDRDKFVALLSELIVATYADRFDTANGQAFRHVATQTAANGVLVSTILEVPSQKVQLDYFFRDGLVFNIAADGVSDLSLRRADYASIIQQQSYDALVVHLQQKIEEARQG